MSAVPRFKRADAARSRIDAALLKANGNDDGGVPLDVDSMFADCRVTEDFVKDVEDAHFQWKHIIAAAHLCVWAAPGGNGKSTIARRAAADMVRDGLRVLYFMEDAGATDFKFLAQHAAQHGYTLINSTAGRKSPDEIFQLIRQLAESSTRLDNTVLVLDTLKKFLDVMGKQGAREFFRVLRAVAVLGGTVLALGHTNKHAGLDGKPVFEGVGDIRNDIDELFYLDAIDDGADRLVTIRADKVRCLAEPCSFRLVRGSLSAVDEPLTDVAALGAVAMREKADERVINAILEILRPRGGENFETLAADAAKLLGIGVKRVRAVIRDYSDENALPRSTRWLITRIPLNNTVRVSLPPT